MKHFIIRVITSETSKMPLAAVNVATLPVTGYEKGAPRGHEGEIHGDTVANLVL